MLRGNAIVLKESDCLGDFVAQRTLTLRLKFGEPFLHFRPSNGLRKRNRLSVGQRLKSAIESGKRQEREKCEVVRGIKLTHQG
jgi:hypothetical protein